MYILTHPQYTPYIEARHRAIEKDAELSEGGLGNSERSFTGQVALITGAAHRHIQHQNMLRLRFQNLYVQN